MPEPNQITNENLDSTSFRHPVEEKKCQEVCIKP